MYLWNLSDMDLFYNEKIPEWSNSFIYWTWGFWMLWVSGETDKTTNVTKSRKPVKQGKLSFLSMWWQLLLLLLSHLSRVRLCVTPEMAAHQVPPSLGFSRQEHWSGLPFPSPMHESEKWKGSCSVVSDYSRPHGLQPTRHPRPWDFPGKSSRVGCHCLLRWWQLICGNLCKQLTLTKIHKYNPTLYN